MSGCPEDIKNELGLVQVYTGNGKGKTTAALGLGFRASGRGLNVIMLQFLKPDGGYGEHMAAKKLENFAIVPMGADHMCGREVPREADEDLARKGLEKAGEVLESGEYDLVILDEVNNSMRFGLIDPKGLIAMLEKRAPHTEVVLTGRGVPQEIIDYADLVTEMKLVKHPFDRGIGARKGIEYRASGMIGGTPWGFRLYRIRHGLGILGLSCHIGGAVPRQIRVRGRGALDESGDPEGDGEGAELV